ncbi:hypothetical protein JW826_02995 [Candidatus Woesearchaeota archaeon]|nr:hypothetical protein [Candidatus Woesearchaeota archaeon]
MAKAETLKVRKKKWFQIVAPKVFREVVVGEVPLYESDQLKGRKMGVNMMNLTGNPRNQSISVKLKVVDVKEGKGVTEVMGFESMPSAIKRIVRRGKSKVDDSFVIQTSDKKLVRIKPLVITSHNVTKSVSTALRRVMRNSIARLAQKLTYEKMIEEIITFKLQKHVQGLCSKITPVKNSEVKAFILVEKQGVRPIVPGKDVDFPKKEEENYDDDEPTSDSESSDAESSDAPESESFGEEDEKEPGDDSAEDSSSEEEGEEKKE